MTDLPASPSHLTVVHAAAETEAVVSWQPPTRAPAPSDYRLRWAKHSPDPLTGPQSWTGSAVTSATSHRISGLVRGVTYMIEVVARCLDAHDTHHLSPPVSTVVTMLAADTEQERFFSVLVPHAAGPAYVRIGPADQSGIEHQLLDMAHHRDLGTAIIPAANDLGPEATTDVVMAAGRDIAVLTGGDIRMRSLKALDLQSERVTTVGSDLVAIVRERNEAGQPNPEGGVVTYTRTHQDAGDWWTTRLDRSATLDIKASVSAGSYQLGAGYNIKVGAFFDQAYGFSFLSKLNNNTELILCDMETSAGLMNLKTRSFGSQYDMLQKSVLTANQIRLETTGDWAASVNPTLKVISTAAYTLSALIATFQLVTTITRFVFINTAGGKDVSALDTFIVKTSVPFSLSNVAAMTLLNFMVVALGCVHFLGNAIRLYRQKRFPGLDRDGFPNLARNGLPGTFVDVLSSPVPSIRLNNGVNAGLVMAEESTALLAKAIRLESGEKTLTVDKRLIGLADAGYPARIAIVEGMVDLTTPKLVHISSNTEVKLVCGENSIVLGPGGIEINGAALNVDSLMAKFGK